MNARLKATISTLLVATAVSLQLVAVLRPALASYGWRLGLVEHAALGVAVYALVFALFWRAAQT